MNIMVKHNTFIRVINDLVVDRIELEGSIYL